MQEQVVVPYPDTLAREPAATHCRSTLLVASTQALKRRGVYEQYVRTIAPRHLEEILSSAAGNWIPIDVGIAHYEACDSLGLSSEDQLKLGGEVVRQLQKTFIGTVLKSASAGMGVTPLAGLEKFTSVYSRSIKGGGARVVRFGPKDVRIDFVGLPLARIRYFRGAYRGFIQAGCEFFSRRVVVAELDSYRSATTLGYRIAWV